MEECEYHEYPFKPVPVGESGQDNGCLVLTNVAYEYDAKDPKTGKTKHYQGVKALLFVEGKFKGTIALDKCPVCKKQLMPHEGRKLTLAELAKRINQKGKLKVNQNDD